MRKISQYTLLIFSTLLAIGFLIAPAKSETYSTCKKNGFGQTRLYVLVNDKNDDFCWQQIRNAPNIAAKLNSQNLSIINDNTPLHAFAYRYVDQTRIYDPIYGIQVKKFNVKNIEKVSHINLIRDKISASCRKEVNINSYEIPAARDGRIFSARAKIFNDYHIGNRAQTTQEIRDFHIEHLDSLKCSRTDKVGLRKWAIVLGIGNDPSVQTLGEAFAQAIKDPVSTFKTRVLKSNSLPKFSEAKLQIQNGTFSDESFEPQFYTPANEKIELLVRDLSYYNRKSQLFAEATVHLNN